jgi:TetR/AcrR family transcriptional regulator
MGRKKEQNEKIKEERRAQIREEALLLFSSKGLSATKIQDIAEAIGMAQGLIYHYFPSKEAIYLELIEHAMDKITQATLSLHELPYSAAEKITLSIEKILSTIAENESFTQTCRLIAQATNSTAIPEKAKQWIQEKRDLPYQEIAKIFAQGQQEGSIIPGDPLELAVLFWTSLNGLAIYQATRQEKRALPHASLLINMFLLHRIPYGGKNES